MSDGGNQEQEAKAEDVVSVLSIVALVSPVGLMIQAASFDVSTFSPIWTFTVRGDGAVYGGFQLSPDPLYLVLMLIFFLPRVVFVFLFRRLYDGKGSLKSTVSVGIFVEYSVVFFVLLQGSMVFNYSDWPYVTIGIPTPILLLSALVVLRYRPLPAHGDWLSTSE